MTAVRAPSCDYPGCGRRTTDPSGLCWQHRRTSPTSEVTAVYGATPLDPDVVTHLVPGLRVNTLAALEILEDQGLASATAHYLRRAVTGDDPQWLLSDHELREFHRHAFDKVWTWAGSYRQRETNIGIEPTQISTQVYALMGDARASWELDTYPLIERAIRLHARIGYIHPFVNGNGRVARLYAELMLAASGSTATLGWSRESLPEPTARRAAYIDALRRGDSTDDYADLVTFATAA